MKTRAATKSKLKSKSASHRKFGWLAVGFLAVFLGMPNATIVRTAVAGGEVDSIFFLFLKYAIMLIFVIPLVIFCLRRPVVMAKNLKNLLIMAAATGSATTVWFVAIEHSTASYTSIISLMAPIMLVILSARLVHDQISRRSVAGISLAAAGGALVVALPTLLHGTASASFYPLATGLMILNSVLTPLSIIYQRKVNQAGVPFVASAGLVAIIMTILILSYLSLTRGSAAITNTLQNLSPAVWWPAIYSGIVASFMARSLAVKSMEQTGAAVRSGLSYLETLMGITLPLLILGEQLSVEMMIGAVLILFGIYLAESSGKHHWFKMGGKYHPHHEYHHGRVR